GSGGLRHRRHHGEPELHPVRHGQQVQPQWHPAGDAVGHDARHGSGGDESDCRDGRRVAGQSRRPNGARTGARPEPGAVRTISPAVLDGTTFFSDPTFWSTFSPARFGPAVWPFFVALVFTAIAVLPARWLAFRLGAVAAPGERRIHSRPTARLGGLAMYLGFGLSAALFSTNPSTLGLLLSAAVVVAIVAATLLLAAINREQMDIVILSGALIGACVGFLFFNWHPARVFMGDTGSNFLGFTLAALSVLSVAKGAVVLALIVPI